MTAFACSKKIWPPHPGDPGNLHNSSRGSVTQLAATPATCRASAKQRAGPGLLTANACAAVKR
jgi:hypothetical protein